MWYLVLIPSSSLITGFRVVHNGPFATHVRRIEEFNKLIKTTIAPVKSELVISGKRIQGTNAGKLIGETGVNYLCRTNHGIHRV